MSRSQLSESRLEASDSAVPSPLVPHVLHPGFAHTRALRLVVQQRLESLRELDRVATHQLSCDTLLNRLADSALADGQHRRSRSHCLERRHAKSFLHGRIYEYG